ncbi:flippase [Chloroflexota bacterium]
MKTPEESSNKQHLGFTKDLAYLAIAEGIVVLLKFSQLPILTKILPDSSLYGTWTLIFSTISMIAPIASLGLGLAMVRFLAAEKDLVKIREGFISIVFVVMCTGTIISLIFILCSDLFASSVLKDIGKSNLVKLASFVVLTHILSGLSIFFFRTFRRMKLYSGLIIMKSATELGLMALFLKLGWELSGIAIAVLISGALTITIALFIVIKRIGFSFPKFTELKIYLKYGLPLIFQNATLWIISSSDRYIIGAILDVDKVGIYSASYALANIMGHLLVPLSMVLFPTISKSYDDGDIDSVKTHLKHSFKYLMMLSIPAAFGLSMIASPLVLILTKPEYASGWVIIPFIAAGLVFYNFHRMGLYIIHLEKKTYLLPWLLGISAVLNIGLNVVFIPLLGIMGAALASLIAYAVLGILTVIVAFRYMRFDLGAIFIIKSIAASALMSLVIWVLSPSTTAEVILSILAGIAVYTATMFLLKGIGKKELVMLKNLISSINAKRLR